MDFLRFLLKVCFLVLFFHALTVFGQVPIPAPLIHPLIPYPINPIKEIFRGNQYTKDNPLLISNANIWMDFCDENNNQVCIFFQWKDDKETKLIFFDQKAVEGKCEDIKFELEPFFDKTGRFSMAAVRVFCANQETPFHKAYLVGEYKTILWETVKTRSTFADRIYQLVSGSADKSALTNYLLVFTDFAGKPVVHSPYLFDKSTRSLEEFQEDFFKNYNKPRPTGQIPYYEANKAFKEQVKSPSSIKSNIEGVPLIKTEDLRVVISPGRNEKINITSKQYLAIPPQLTLDQEKKLIDALIKINQEDIKFEKQNKSIFSKFKSLFSK